MLIHAHLLVYETIEAHATHATLLKKKWSGRDL